MGLYIDGLGMQLVSAYLYFLGSKNNPSFSRLLNGKVLLGGAFLSAYAFSKIELKLDNKSDIFQKTTSQMIFNCFWGASICSFFVNFLPQVNLGLVLP